MAGNSKPFNSAEAKQALFWVERINRMTAQLERMSRTLEGPKLDRANLAVEISKDPIISAFFAKAVDKSRPYGNLDQLRSHVTRLSHDLEMLAIT
ncbi:hypothetical protein CCP3SC15_730021 [Gammaproteobacteria bacterium]